MSRPLAVLRPEPGNAATCARIARIGLTALAIPLFEIRPICWKVPDLTEHDALLVTSANAIRLAGAGLEVLRRLPVLAVGSASAVAAREAGFTVIAVGSSDVEATLRHAEQHGITHALHLAGRDRIDMPSDAISRTITVYASDPRTLDRSALTPLDGAVALVHSARAAQRLGDLVDTIGPARAAIRIAAISPAVAAAAGTGWQAMLTAERPGDDALLNAARVLAD